MAMLWRNLRKYILLLYYKKQNKKAFANLKFDYKNYKLRGVGNNIEMSQKYRANRQMENMTRKNRYSRKESKVGGKKLSKK